MFCARAAWIAPLSRAFMAGSGRPIFAAAVISRASLEKSLERFLSWAPLRNWMFLNFEWPAMGPLSYWLSAFAVRPRLIGVGPPEIQGSPFRVHKGPLSEALTLMARQLKVRGHFRRAVPAAY